MSTEELWIVGHNRNFYPSVTAFASQERAEEEFEKIVNEGSIMDEEEVYLAQVVRKAVLPAL